MNKIIFKNFQTQLGELMIGSFDNRLCLCDWKFRKLRETIDIKIQNALNATYVEGESQIIETVIFQLGEYFNKKRTKFTIPLLPVGTPFQKKVWSELEKIPYGNKISYLELSKQLKNEKAIRSIAGANALNPFAIIIPCHRVIGKDGNLTGYSGGLVVKRNLLELEKSIPIEPELFFLRQFEYKYV